MRVNRIEIFGFKSFMERLVLPLEGGISGVVGPNGCGKSNIVDAVRWVLGETRASSLRGGVLEDVIFNGTDNLRPLGLAEVTLTIRASNSDFFQDLVSPELEASLAIEEATGDLDALNSDPASEEGSPEADSEELNISDSEESTPHLTVLDGGATDSVSTNGNGANPTMGNAATLSARFSWLRAVSEVQVTRRLYRSGESEFFLNRVPCRLKDLKDFYRAIGLSARAYTIVAQGEVSRIVTAKPEERRQILEEAAGVLGFRDKITAAERRLKETETNLSRLGDIISEIERQVNSLKRQATRARNRESLKYELREGEQKLFRDSYLGYHSELQKSEGEVSGIREQEAGIEAKLERILAEEREARNVLMSIDVEGDQLRGRIDSIREELGNRDRQRSEKESRVRELEAYSVARDAEHKQTGERKSVLEDRKSVLFSGLQRLVDREKELEHQLAGIQREGEDVLAARTEQLEGFRKHFQQIDNQLREVREKRVRLESERKSILDRSGWHVDQVPEDLPEDLQKLFQSGARPVDRLNIPENILPAVEAILGKRAGYFIVENPLQYAEMYQQVAGTALMPGFLGNAEQNLSSDAAVPFPTLLSQFEMPSDLQPALSKFFENVYLVENSREALRFFETADLSGIDTPVLVTRSGEVFSRDEAAGAVSHEGIFSTQKHLEEIEAEILQAREVEQRFEQEKDQCLQNIKDNEEEQRSLLRSIQQSRESVRELSNELGSIRGRKQAEERLLTQLDEDVQTAVTQMSDALRRMEEYREESVRVKKELEALVSTDETEKRNEVEKLEEQYRELDAHRKEGLQKLEGISQKVDEGRAELDAIRGTGSDHALEIQKLQMEIDHLQEKILGEYDESMLKYVFEESPEDGVLSGEERSELEEQVNRLRRRIAREGEVDPESIQRFEEEQARLEDLINQRADLTQAKATLEKTIEKLRNISEERFMSCFAAIRDTFTRLGPRLFGGGKTDLRLSDPDLPLDSGVEIIARPPGKKLKSIELLSGGEKALCATALIMAMFSQRPSPLCILDEVDAPLDDANLMRFLSLIKEMSSKTQFIMITHNKQSMGMADRLVGVTMQEPGASKVLTVSLEEAYTQAVSA